MGLRVRRFRRRNDCLVRRCACTRAPRLSTHQIPSNLTKPLPRTSLQHHYGWIPDHPDPRDHPYVPPKKILENLPMSVDLRPQLPPVYDQGHLQSCTANAIATVFQYDMVREEERRPFRPSRLFIYYNARV